MFLKQGKSEMKDFVEEKKFGSKGKILRKYKIYKKIFLKMFLTDTLAKVSQHIFTFYLVSEHLTLFWDKNFLAAGGGVDLKNASFFDVLPIAVYIMSVKQHSIMLYVVCSIIQNNRHKGLFSCLHLLLYDSIIDKRNIMYI